MSKPVSANQDAALQASTRRTAYCVKIKKRNGEFITLTDVNKSFTVDAGDGDGPLLYIPKSGFDRVALEASSDFSVNSTSIKISLSTFGITREDVRRHRFVGAEIKTFLVVDYDDLTLGIIRLASSKIGKTSIINNNEGTIEILGLLHSLSHRIVDLTSPTCRVDLFSEKCKVQSDPSVWTSLMGATATVARDAGIGTYVRPTVYNDRHFKCTTAGAAGNTEPAWNTSIGGTTSDGSIVWTTIRSRKVLDATVTSIVSNNSFRASIPTDAPDSYLQGGTVTFNSGFASGLSYAVKTWNSTTRQFTVLPFPREDIQVGDTFDVTAGCDFRWATCRDTFDNQYNNRSEHLTPNSDYVITFPDAPT